MTMDTECQYNRKLYRQKMGPKIRCWNDNIKTIKVKFADITLKNICIGKIETDQILIRCVKWHGLL